MQLTIYIVIGIALLGTIGLAAHAAWKGTRK